MKAIIAAAFLAATTGFALTGLALTAGSRTTPRARPEAPTPVQQPAPRRLDDAIRLVLERTQDRELERAGAQG